MALTPSNRSGIADIVTAVETTPAAKPSLTYEFDFLSKSFTGRRVDGESAFGQAVIKTLSTVRFRHLIYDAEYGNEIGDLIGNDVSDDYLQSEIPRLVKETLLADDRVGTVTEVSVTRGSGSDSVYVSATVTSIDSTTINLRGVEISG